MSEFSELINNRQEAEVALNSKDPDRINMALAQIIFFEKDLEWLISQYMRFLNHSESLVRALAAAKLGDVALIHRQSSKQALTALQNLLEDPEPIVVGSAQEAIDDILFYVPDLSEQA